MIIGIDLGTTNSLVSVFTESGPVLVPNALGSALTPSAVHMDDDGRVIVGASARDHLINSPEATTSRFKRLMGTPKSTRMRGTDFSPEDLSSMVLRALRRDAEAHLGEEVREAVISVPAYFNEIQRKATIHAAELAGLKVRRLINEPTAAALAYGLQDKDAENTFLIVDLGGGTFDVSILEMFSGVMEVRSSAGDAFLGGEDFTDRITAHFAEQLGTKLADLAPQDLSRLRALADTAKHRISDEPRASVTYRHGDEERSLSLSRDIFETLTEDLTNRMKVPLQRAIGDAGLTAGDIDRIVLVGGATRMVPVRSLITRLFKRFPEHALDPDAVVALGAAVQAGLIARDAALDDVVMTDVCPFTLGFESSRRTGEGDAHETGIFIPLIERNTTIPASRSEVVEAVQAGQTRVVLNIYQGEAPYVRDNIRIGSYMVALPYNAKEPEKVDVRFTYDSSGVLEVLSTVVSTGVAKTLIIENAPGAMTPEAIAKRFKELEKIKIHPRDEAVNEAMISRVTAAYENALGQRRTQIGMLLSTFEAALRTHDKRHIAQTRSRVEETLKGMAAPVSSTDPFKALGLARKSATEADVKAAYARLLKVTRPEDDRAAFMALRQAFDAARSAARFSDQTRLNASKAEAQAAPGEASDEARGALPGELSAERSDALEDAAPAEDVTWSHDPALNWNFNTSPSGRLIEETIRWMIAGGPDPDAFAARAAEALISMPAAHVAAFRTELVTFIVCAADPEGLRHGIDVWKPVPVTRPDWLTADIIRLLHRDLGILGIRPDNSWAARDYNAVLDLFEHLDADPAAPTARGAKSAPLPQPVDIEALHEREETEARRDAHGSFFDRDAKKWADRSPVTTAMRDLQAAFDRNMWDLPQVCRAILVRDEVQALDEFQDLDARLRQFVCGATSWQSGAREPSYPDWLRPQVVQLLDATFGWSRQFGRNHWDRQQYEWLHNVLGRDIDIRSNMPEFRAASGPEQWPDYHQAAPRPTFKYNVWAWLLRELRNLVMAYMGYRAMQILWRLVT